eukprot:gb/GEZN01007151.1/.p1 GENE.gb/GEZN01007151.1/~~gb/GEZN01007151.1/.p1  ORF type:complete len:484 (+),score=52.02 gb/GEZN01007151.1/:29-1453(+)
MSGLDYVMLEDGPGTGVSALLHPAKAAAGLIGLLTAAAALNTIKLFRSDVPIEPEEADEKFVPKEGLAHVITGRPLSPLALYSPSHPSPSCLFVYGAKLEKKHRKEKLRKSEENGWVYGATAEQVFVPGITDANDELLAYVTGVPTDILKGKLVCFPSSLRPTDPPPDENTQTGIVSVVKEDGTSQNAYWFYQTSSPDPPEPSGQLETQSGVVAMLAKQTSGSLIGSMDTNNKKTQVSLTDTDDIDYTNQQLERLGWLKSQPPYDSTTTINPPGDDKKKTLGGDGINLWPNATVFFTIESNADSTTRTRVLRCMGHIQKYTCIRFVTRKTERAYVRINSDRPGCFSNIGFLNNSQHLNVAVSCRLGQVLHEIMHTLGGPHVHNRPDRDNYVTIYPENIVKSKMFNFEKVTIGLFAKSYDYDSILHYTRKTFSSNGQDTIRPRGPGGADIQIGQRKGLSTLDKEFLNKAYCEVPR